MRYLDIDRYYPTPNLDCSEEEILMELSVWLNNPNNTTYNIIDFERLIYLEAIYGNKENFKPLIEAIKKSIAENYQVRQRLINRLALNIRQQ